MIRAFKTEVKLTNEQKHKFHQDVGICRWLYNHYIDRNKQAYQQYQNGDIDKNEAFISAFSFDKYINNEVKVKKDFQWINNCGSKARKKAIVDAEKAFKRFFQKKSSFPRFKKRSNNDMKLYYPKNGKTSWTIERHRINIPTFKWVRIKDYGYLPNKKINRGQMNIISGTLSEKAGRYFVSIIVKDNTIEYKTKRKTEPIGIDLGIKDFAILSNKTVYKNINKTKTILKLEKKLKREKRKFSRKYEDYKKNKKKGGTATSQNIQKQRLIVQKLHYRITNIRTDYINKIISSLVERNPSSITIEDLNVKGMMKNRHLSKAVSQQKFYEFRTKLQIKCQTNQIELRMVNRWYPSSKLCSCCGHKKNELRLSERTYKCEQCNMVLDRDINASINLRDAIEYTRIA